MLILLRPFPKGKPKAKGLLPEGTPYGGRTGQWNLWLKFTTVLRPRFFFQKKSCGDSAQLPLGFTPINFPSPQGGTSRKNDMGAAHNGDKSPLCFVEWADVAIFFGVGSGLENGLSNRDIGRICNLDVRGISLDNRDLVAKGFD